MKGISHVCSTYRSVFTGRMPDPLLKDPYKMLGIFEVELIRNLADRFAVIEDPFFRNIDHLRLIYSCADWPVSFLIRSPK